MSHDNEYTSGHRFGPLLRIERREAVSGVILEVRGEIDLCTGDQLAKALREAVRRAFATVTRVVVDLRGVTFMGVAGLRILARANEACRHAGIGLTVVADQSSVLRLLRIAALDRVLTVVPVPPAGPTPTRNGTSGLGHGGQ